MTQQYHTARTAIGLVGNVISFGLFLAPVPTFWNIYKRKSTEQFSALPYLATALNCLLWAFYGIPAVTPDSILVTTINVIGLVIEVIYLGIYCLYATKNQRIRYSSIFAGEVAFFLAVVVGVLKGAHTHHLRSLIVGILCVIFGTGMYLAPLSVMNTVIRTKSVQYMPLSLSAVSFVNSVIWTTYGFLPPDKFLLIPNGLGVVLTTLQLVLYAVYYRATPRDDHNKTPETHAQLPVSSVAPSISIER